MLLATDLSMGLATGTKGTPISSFSLGDPHSQDGKPVKFSPNSSHGSPQHLIWEPWKVTMPIHRDTLVEVQDEILDDTLDLEVTRFREVSHVRKRRRVSSLSLMPFRQREEEVSSLSLGSHNCATQLHQYAHGNPLEAFGEEAQVSQKLSATRSGKPLKSILRSRFPSDSRSFYIRCLNKPRWQTVKREKKPIQQQSLPR